MAGVAVHETYVGPVFCVQLSELHEVIDLDGLVKDELHNLDVLVVDFCKGSGIEEFLDVKGGVTQFAGFDKFVFTGAFANGIQIPNLPININPQTLGQLFTMNYQKLDIQI